MEEDQSLASAHQQYSKIPETIELIQVAVDHRPGIPYLVSIRHVVLRLTCSTVHVLYSMCLSLTQMECAA